MPRLSLKADSGVGAIAVSPYSRDVVLASRTGLYVVDIQNPLALPRWLPLRSAWEVTSADWCSAPGKEYRVVTASNQKALVWNLGLPSERAIEQVLHGHRRAVTDTKFSNLEPELLATSSIDATVKIWDLRQNNTSANSAATTFADFDAGALQAQWSSVDPFQLASAHNNRIVLWDTRKANIPVDVIHAHQGECNGIRFLPGGDLLSCSTDCTVKLWDTNDTKKPKLQINTKFPVWRAIPAPFELGALILPLRGGNNTMGLINLASKSNVREYKEVLLSTFTHGGAIKDLALMRSSSKSGFNIATWCRDQQLRLWDGKLLHDLPHASSYAGCKDQEFPPIPPFNSYNTTSYDDSKSSPSDYFELSTLNQRNYQSRAIEHLDWISGVHLNNNEDTESQTFKDVANHETFEQEILAILRKFPKIEVFEFSAQECKVSLFGPWGDNESLAKLMIKMKAPYRYPAFPLRYQIVASDDLKHGIIKEIESNLWNFTRELASHSLPAVEFCIRYLVGDPVSIQDTLSYGDYQTAETNATEIDTNEITTNENEYTTPPSTQNSKRHNPTNSPTTAPRSADGSLPDMEMSNDDNSSVTNASIDLEPIELPDNPADTFMDTTPLPRTCGAVWSLTGQLICFFNKPQESKSDRPLPLNKIFNEKEVIKDVDGELFVSETDEHDDGLFLGDHTPWTATANTLNLNTGMTPYETTSNATKSQYRNRSRTVTSADSQSSSTRLINSNNNSQSGLIILQLGHLWPSRPDLAAEYSSDLSILPSDLAKHNYEVALKYQIPEEAYIWQLLFNYAAIEQLESYAIKQPAKDPKIFFEWFGGTIGTRSLIPKIAKELEQNNRIQTLSCISCLFSSLRGYKQRQYTLHSKDKKEFKSTPVNAIDAFEQFDEEETNKAIEKITKFRREYARLLHKWGLYIKKTEMLKLDADDPLLPSYQPLLIGQSGPDLVNAELKSSTCALCMRQINRLFMHCPNCSHAMHDTCGKTWWSLETECPKACGCICKDIFST